MSFLNEKMINNNYKNKYTKYLHSILNNKPNLTFCFFDWLGKNT